MSDFFSDLMGMFGGNPLENQYVTANHIIENRTEYEEELNDLWSSYGRGSSSSLNSYNNKLKLIKSKGLKVFRNNTGKHKIQ